MANIVALAKSIRNLAQDDHRRVIHSLKVGVAVTLVSLFYYTQPLYNGFGTSALWGVLTVIVVFEFYVGASLYKGLNRIIATLLAGALGVGVHSLASKCGDIGQPLLIGLLVFLQAAVATFMRFFPKIKARYDYGFLIFILTFAFVSISGFRVEEIIELARNRGGPIVIGVFGTLFVSILAFPVWAGEDLHNLVADSINKLGDSLDGFGVAYCKMDENSLRKVEILSLQSYKSVLSTKNREETLANFARWEPCHGRFMFRHPWTQYLKLGSLTRECAFKLEALNSHINLSNNKEPTTFKREIREECGTMSSEASRVLKELAVSLKDMTQPSSCEIHIAKSKAGVNKLKDILKTSSLWKDSELLQIIPAATVASILFDIIDCTEKIADCANELSSLAHFMATKLEKQHSQPANVDLKIDILDSSVDNKSDCKDQSRITTTDVVIPVVCSHVAITIVEQVTESSSS